MGAEEGYTKYQCLFSEHEIEASETLSALISTRQRLFELGLIGVLPDGVGFGNISARAKDQTFLITGSGTGAVKQLDRSHFCLVTNSRIDQNLIEAKGSCRPSSESLTHAACYLASSAVGAVVHVHSAKIWRDNIDQLPTTPRAAEYGTPEMARAVKLLVERDRELTQGVVIMSGHEDGVIFYARDLEGCMERVECLLSGGTS